MLYNNVTMVEVVVQQGLA